MITMTFRMCGRETGNDFTLVVEDSSDPVVLASCEDTFSWDGLGCDDLVFVLEFGLVVLDGISGMKVDKRQTGFGYKNRLSWRGSVIWRISSAFALVFFEVFVVISDQIPFFLKDFKILPLFSFFSL